MGNPPASAQISSLEIVIGDREPLCLALEEARALQKTLNDALALDIALVAAPRVWIGTGLPYPDAALLLRTTTTISSDGTTSTLPPRITAQ